MSNNKGSSDFLSLPEPVLRVLDGVAKALFWGGLAVLLGCVGILVANYMRGAGVKEADIVSNVGLVSGPAIIASVAMAVGVGFLFWGEEILGPALLIGGGALLLAPIYMPLILPTPPTRGDLILDAMSHAGWAPGIMGAFTIVWDLIWRMRNRAFQGAKADQLKFGKGIAEERDIRNVFMGKCWQLPYCRKFVRERCPIYHSKKTCWKERVGCMCEEQVIRNAMEGKVIPKDMVAATKFIPRNTRLTPEQKAERCRQCVIYNEHQKHKYKLAVPASFVAVTGLYFLLRVPASAFVLNLVVTANSVLSKATVNAVGNDAVKNAPSLGGLQLHEVLVLVLFFIIAVYSIRIIEFLIFRIRL